MVSIAQPRKEPDLSPGSEVAKTFEFADLVGSDFFFCFFLPTTSFVQAQSLSMPASYSPVLSWGFCSNMRDPQM